MLVVLGKGLSFKIERESGSTYSGIMTEFGDILQMRKRFFYQEKYLR